jgi:hypothetical protein
VAYCACGLGCLLMAVWNLEFSFLFKNTYCTFWLYGSHIPGCWAYCTTGALEWPCGRRELVSTGCNVGTMRVGLGIARLLAMVRLALLQSVHFLPTLVRSVNLYCDWFGDSQSAGGGPGMAELVRVILSLMVPALVCAVVVPGLKQLCLLGKSRYSPIDTGDRWFENCVLGV